MFAKKFGGNIVLGSTSPRRAEILRKLDIPFCIRPSNFDESELMKRKNVNLQDMVEDIATAKGKDIPIDENEFLISADTLIGNGSLIYGKPQNKAEHLERLKALNNSTHSVMTGVCLRYQGKQKTFSVESKVNFGTHSNETLQWYVDSGDGDDKAGGYGTQALGAVLVKSIEGCFYNVMGLPLYDLVQEIEKILE